MRASPSTNSRRCRGKAEVALRVRLQQTQKLVAVAEMNDGTLYTASREVKVTIGGCGG